MSTLCRQNIICLDQDCGFSLIAKFWRVHVFKYILYCHFATIVHKSTILNFRWFFSMGQGLYCGNRPWYRDCSTYQQDFQRCFSHQIQRYSLVFLLLLSLYIDLMANNLSLTFLGTAFDVSLSPKHVSTYSKFMKEKPKLDIDKIIIAPMPGKVDLDFFCD